MFIVNHLIQNIIFLIIVWCFLVGFLYRIIGHSSADDIDVIETVTSNIFPTFEFFKNPETSKHG